MPRIVTFIGWHNSGKTTLATQVVRHLKDAGYRVAVIKSSKETGIVFDTPGTDTDKHRQAGADGVLFVAPDQMVLMADNNDLPLAALARRYFPDADIVIGEGFKAADQVAKIEVARGSGPLLRDQVRGVIAVATDQDIAGDRIFRLHESRAIAAFIEQRLLRGARQEADNTVLLVNGNSVPLDKADRQLLAGALASVVNSLKLGATPREIELRVRINRP